MTRPARRAPTRPLLRIPLLLAAVALAVSALAPTSTATPVLACPFNGCSTATPAPTTTSTNEGAYFPTNIAMALGFMAAAMASLLMTRRRL